MPPVRVAFENEGRWGVEAKLVLAYGALIFLATVVASIPFGFVEGFAKARGKPLSDRMQARLRLPELAIEATAVCLVIASLAMRHPDEPILHAVSATLVASFLSFVVEVRTRLMTIEEFWRRLLLGLLLCLPVGLFIGASVGAGA